MATSCFQRISSDENQEGGHDVVALSFSDTCGQGLDLDLHKEAVVAKLDLEGLAENENDGGDSGRHKVAQDVRHL